MSGARRVVLQLRTLVIPLAATVLVAGSIAFALVSIGVAPDPRVALGSQSTDVSVDYVVLEPAYDLDVSAEESRQVQVGVRNVGIVTDVETTLLLKSQVGTCEARWVSLPGDTIVFDNIGGELQSLLEVILPSMQSGEVREVERSYTIHCFSKSFHDNAVRFEVGVVPLFPMGDSDATNNVAKLNIDLTAFVVADVMKLGLVIPESTFLVGEVEPVVVRSVLHNNGPFGPAQILDDITATAPPDCTLLPDQILDIPITLPVSVAVTVDQTFTLQCSQPSFHTFCWNDVIELDMLHVRDPNLSDNSAQECITETVLGDADVKVTGGDLTLPSLFIVDVSFFVTVNVTLHNNGPSTSANVDALFDLAVPTDCTRFPTGTQTASEVSLAASTTVSLSRAWTVSCSETGLHSLEGSAAITLDQVHATDPDTNNNTRSFAGDITLDTTIPGPPVVGGMVGLLEADDAPSTTSATPNGAAFAATLAGVVATLLAGGWYARRRWLQ